MTQEGKDVSQQTAMRLIASGGTSIASGLDCGIAVMEQRRQRNPVGAVFLLTDGQDSTSRDQIQQLVNRARAAHCCLYAFGFGEDHDTTILNAVAESSQTPFTYVERQQCASRARLTSCWICFLEVLSWPSVRRKTAPTGLRCLRCSITAIPQSRPFAID